MTQSTHEFPDRLSPMLVKELRQGLRTKGFLVAFLIIQGILALSVLAAQESSSSGNGSFFWILGLALVTILPLRALAAFATEESRENLDLVRLTKLSTWRIVLGKWAALAAQSALFITTILPYVVLRYFTGGVNPLFDLAWVLTLFLLGTTFTAIALTLSTIRHPIPRLAGAASLIISSLYTLGILFNEYYNETKLPGNSALIWLLFLMIVASALTFALLSSAVSLSSTSENYATPRRILSLASLTAILIATTNNSGEIAEQMLLISLIIAIIAFITAFSEPASSKSAFNPISPGYRSSILFGAICALLASGCIISIRGAHNWLQPLPATVTAGSLIATLLAPAALALLSRRFFSNRLAAYFCYAALTAIFLSALFAFSESLSIGKESTLFHSIGSISPSYIIAATSSATYSITSVHLLATIIHLAIQAIIFTITLRSTKQ